MGVSSLVMYLLLMTEVLHYLEALLRVTQDLYHQHLTCKASKPLSIGLHVATLVLPRGS